MKILLFLLMTILALCPTVSAETLEERVKKLENALNMQEQIIREQQKKIEQLSGQKEQIQTEVIQSTGVDSREKEKSAARDYRLDDRSKAIAMQSASPISPYQITEKQTPSLLNPSISLIFDSLYYQTNLSEEELEEREIPGYVALHEHGEGSHSHGHGTFEKGFNLRSAELTIFAPVDPYFNLYATIPFTEDGSEVEEAYFVTTSLPAGLQIKGGKFKSGFGRFNAFHPHAWDFVDAPLPYTAFLGGEGLIEKGVQFTYLPPLPVYTLLGFEILQGENEVLYGEEAKSGPHAYAGFAKMSLDFGEYNTILWGISVTGGETKTESIEHETEFSGDSVLYGAELTYKWKPSKDRSLILQSEYLLRHQTGDFEYLEDSTVDSLKRTQDGLYLQGLYQIDRWRIGARYDVLSIFKDTYKLAGEEEDFGDNPYRLTGSLEFNPTEFSRLRLQYTYDKSAGNGKENNELFLQLILGIGAHGAHSF
ncbi:MAG: hypothetical protein FJ241_12215 [Nitrospira sp.]|nr:hypothetical protein [Nitrospira sp.]